MNVASKELCQELYELSSWLDTDSIYAFLGDEWKVYNDSMLETHGLKNGHHPAYDLGYLLRSLPKNIPTDKQSYFTADLSLAPNIADTWNACYRVGASFPNMGCTADTPEDAACKLAIELFKQRILK